MTNYDPTWSKCWDLAKKHGCTKGFSKQSIYRERPGYVDMWLTNLKQEKKITQAEYKLATSDIHIGSRVYKRIRMGFFPRTLSGIVTAMNGDNLVVEQTMIGTIHVKLHEVSLLKK